MIKEWFANYFIHTSDVTFDFTNGPDVVVHSQHAELWKVTIVDMGLNKMTGGRVKRIQQYVSNEAFCLTYGDGVRIIMLLTICSQADKPVGTMEGLNLWG